MYLILIIGVTSYGALVHVPPPPLGLMYVHCTPVW